MGKKDKKSKSVEQKARVAAKQNKKAAQKEKKGKVKGTDDSDAEDVDLDSVLGEYAKKQEQFLKISESVCDGGPSARTSATFIGSPANSKELFLFGGEYYNGALASFFNDLFVYNTAKDEWKRVTSPNSPLPRSGHAWCRGGHSGGVYLFGGEFSSPKQGTFYHYNDFWRLEPATREWTRIDSKGKSPPARSGHRMTYYKNYILVYGGFQDTSQQTRYLQDLWIYDCQNFVWHNPTPPSATMKPDARSSFSFHPNDRGAVLYGGYSRVKSNVKAGKQGKGISQATKSVLRPMIHEDTWFLRITSPPMDGSVASPQIRWEKRKKPGNPPNPPRAGATQAFHQGRGIAFGGVHDVEESEEGIDSEFFDTLYAWNIERNRFFQLPIRRGRAAPKRQVEDRQKKGRGKAGEADLLRNLAALEKTGSIAGVEELDLGLSDEDEEPMPVKPILESMPHRRFNAQLAIQGDIVYILGGTYEQGDREYTFDEMHAIDLKKLDGVKEIYKRELDDWKSASDDDDDSENDEFSDSQNDDSDEVEGGVAIELAKDPPKPEPIGDTHQTVAAEEDQESSVEGVPDDRPQPRPFESLREFFVRTCNAWQELVLAKVSLAEKAAGPSVKGLRKEAFGLAEVKWWDCREEIGAEEERQEASGIGEIVSLGDRSKDSIGADRRR